MQTSSFKKRWGGVVVIVLPGNVFGRGVAVLKNVIFVIAGYIYIHCCIERMKGGEIGVNRGEIKISFISNDLQA